MTSDLNDILLLIAAQIKVDGNDLIKYAIEDELGGYHIDEDKRLFPMGSLWGSEGKILYAITRAIKPELIVQVGGWVGCSAAHFALACKANGKGRVVSIDNGQDGQIHGSHIPRLLNEYVELITANGEDWLAEQADDSIDLVFEDAGHSRESVAAISKVALQKLLPGGLLINHDAAHDFAFVGGGARIFSPVGKQVRDGLEDAGARFKPYRTDDSDCGLSISIKPNDTQGWGRGEHSGLSPRSVIELDKYSVKDQGIDLSLHPDFITMERLQEEISRHDLETDDSPLVKDQMDSTPEPKKRTRRKRNAATGKLE